MESEQQAIAAERMPGLATTKIQPRQGWEIILVALVFAAAAFLLFFRLGAGSLHSWTEAIYAQIGREILSTGDWNTLHHNGRLYLKKPPLFMWLTAFSFRTLGISEFSARLFSPLFALSIFLLVYLLARRMGSWQVGLGAILILLHGVKDWHYAHRYNFLALSRTANLDIPITCFIAWSMYLLWRGRENPRCLVWMGIPLGLGIMTKSAVGLLPFLMALLFLFFTRKRVAWSCRHLVAGFGLGFLIAAPWHLGQWLLHGREFWNDYVSTTLISRVSEYMTRTKHETYYLTVIRKGFGMSAYLLPLAVLYAVFRGARRQEDSSLLLLLWALLPLLLFSLSRDKNGWYIIHTYPALALLLSQFLWNILSQIGKRPWAYGGVILLLFASGLRFPAPADPARDLKVLAPCVQAWVKPAQILYEYGMSFHTPAPNLTFYADRLTRSVGKGPLEAALKRDGLFLVTTTDHWIPGEHGGRLLCQSGKWVLLHTEGGRRGGPVQFPKTEGAAEEEASPED
jgi:4-amino-4-deoxy-L-arabinose transferase-like glycosyltransferase